jgi:hypothetical protein
VRVGDARSFQQARSPTRVSLCAGEARRRTSRCQHHPIPTLHKEFNYVWNLQGFSRSSQTGTTYDGSPLKLSTTEAWAKIGLPGR